MPITTSEMVEERMRITPEEAAQIMGNSEMDCDECPFHSPMGGGCQTSEACADVALQAGKVMLEEAEQDAFDMAMLLDGVLDMQPNKGEAAEEMIKLAAEVTKKYEDHR